MPYKYKHVWLFYFRCFNYVPCCLLLSFPMSNSVAVITWQSDGPLRQFLLKHHHLGLVLVTLIPNLNTCIYIGITLLHLTASLPAHQSNLICRNISDKGVMKNALYSYHYRCRCDGEFVGTTIYLADHFLFCVPLSSCKIDIYTECMLFQYTLDEFFNPGEDDAGRFMLIYWSTIQWNIHTQVQHTYNFE